MQREAQLLRLLDAVLGSVFSGQKPENAIGEAARRMELSRQVSQTADYAKELALPETEAAARQLVALLEPAAGDGDWQPRIEEQAEHLQALAEQELEARIAGSSPSRQAGPGMPWGDFVIESREHLANIEQELLRLENAPDDSESVHALFRSFHTIKGLAAIAGTETAREVAHQTENLLDEVRSGTRPVSSALIDLALASADFLGEVVSAAEQLDRGEAAEIPEDAAALLDQLYTAISNEAMPERVAGESLPLSSADVSTRR